MSNKPRPLFRDWRLRIGDTLKSFKVQRHIGEGAYGQIYMVNHESNKLKVAAAKIEPRMENSNDEILKMEIHVLMRLKDSKHVCRVYEWGNTEKIK
jgi:serine/threonine protein kinase